MSATRVLHYLAFLLLASSLTAVAETVTHTVSSDGKTEVWLINEPDVGADVAEYAFKPHTDIRFQPGDGITIEAGGCVQTGGHGNTWKRYVNPSGPNSDKYYYGTIWIPGVIGAQAPNVTRIVDVLGNRWGVPATAAPNNLYLLLGYLDDNYSDNGYYSHDDGTEDQCKDSQNAWVRVTVAHGAGGKLWSSDGKLAPYDLLSDGDDDNLIPLNPYWSYLTKGIAPSDAHPAKEPTADTSCSGDGIVTIAAANGPDHPPCVSDTTITSRDDADDLKTFLFDYDPTQNTFAFCTHANWGPATYTGMLQFESHSDPDQDDDYSWDFRRTDLRGLAGDRDNIEPEFNSEETVQFFSSPWWVGLRSAVNSDTDGNFTAAKTYFGSKFAIITGLFGLDLAHYPAHSELHPVFAMAVRVKEDDPNDEHWALFVRRFGDEGFCSSQEHYLDFLPDNKFVFHLPLLWPNAVLDDNVVMDMRAEHSAGDPPKVEFVPGQGVYVTFDLPENPSARQLIHGELHLKWDNVIFSSNTMHATTAVLAPHAAGTAGTAKKATVIRPELHVVLSHESEDENGLDDSFTRILKAMSKEQRLQFEQRVPRQVIVPSTVVLPKTAKPVRLASRPKVRIATRRPSVSAVPNTAKVARDQQKMAAIKAIVGPTMPKHP